MTNQNKEYLGRWDEKTLINLVLLLLLFLIIFIVPIFPVETHKLLFNLLITAVILVSVLAMDKGRKTLFLVALAGIALHSWHLYALGAGVYAGLLTRVALLQGARRPALAMHRATPMRVPGATA